IVLILPYIIVVWKMASDNNQVATSTVTPIAPPVKTAKDLWKSLDHKYVTEDAGAKKFIVGEFLNYKMVESKGNVVEKAPKVNNNKKRKYVDDKGDDQDRDFKRLKFKGKCYICDKPGHREKITVTSIRRMSKPV
ncbi:hypothetical protein U1Q18_025756, partial [Sarracenia purpurea var. burkii]